MLQSNQKILKDWAMANEANLKAKLKEIDDRIAELNEKIELAKIVEDIEHDERFKKLIIEGYLEKEAERLFSVLVEPSSLKRDVIENIQDKLSGIRNLKQYFGVIGQNANMAPDQIAEEEAYRKEVTAYYANLPIDAETVE